MTKALLKEACDSTLNHVRELVERTKKLDRGTEEQVRAIIAMGTFSEGNYNGGSTSYQAKANH